MWHKTRLNGRTAWTRPPFENTVEASKTESLDDQTYVSWIDAPDQANRLVVPRRKPGSHSSRKAFRHQEAKTRSLCPLRTDSYRVTMLKLHAEGIVDLAVRHRDVEPQNLSRSSEFEMNNVG